jgi:rhodanese-related sulfurtransferase
MMTVFLVAAAVSYVHPEQLVDTAWLAAHAMARTCAYWICGVRASRRVTFLRRTGSIPSARALYWEDLLDPVRKTFKAADELRAVVERTGMTPPDEVIAYCWVGHRSAVDLFALRLVGYERVRVEPPPGPADRPAREVSWQSPTARVSGRHSVRALERRPTPARHAAEDVQ